MFINDTFRHLMHSVYIHFSASLLAAAMQVSCSDQPEDYHVTRLVLRPCIKGALPVRDPDSLSFVPVLVGAKAS